MQNFIYTLLICSATMSAVSVLFMLLSPLLSKRYSAKWQYYAWLVIIIGFIVPFRPNFNFKIFTVPVPASPVQDEITDIPIQYNVTNTPLNIDTTERDNNEEKAVSPTETSGILQNRTNGAEANPIRTLSSDEILFLIFIVWIIGTVAVLGYNLFRHYRLMRMINRWKEEITDMRTLDILQRQKEMLNIKKNISIQQCSLIIGSILTGLTKPAILLQTTKYSDEELSLVIRHELIHFKRKDLFFKILVLTAKSIHWFNPVVYLIVKAISAQCEKACDEAVVVNVDSAVRTRYALFIADIAKNQSGIQTALTTNFYGGKYNMKNRLLSIIDKNKKRKGIIIICLALILTLCTSIVLAANTNNYNDNNNEIDLSEKNNFIDTLESTNEISDKSPDELFNKCTPEIYNFVHYISQVADNVEYKYFTVESFEAMIDKVNIPRAGEILEEIKAGKQLISEISFDILDENGNSVMEILDNGKKHLNVVVPENYNLISPINYAAMSYTNATEAYHDLTSAYDWIIQYYETRHTPITINYYTPEEYKDYIEEYKTNIDIKVAQGYPRRLIERTIAAMEKEVELIKQGKQIISAIFLKREIDGRIITQKAIYGGGEIFVSSEDDSTYMTIESFGKSYIYVTTPKDQKLVRTADGTIMLPGGGIIQIEEGEKKTFPNNTIIDVINGMILDSERNVIER